MQVSHPQAAIEDFQTGIFSNDPVEFNAAVNLYVEPQASYSSSLISTHGASKIKNILALEKLFIREIRVDRRKSSGISGGGGGGGQWDEDSQVYFVPTLTTYGLPFALPIIDLSFTFPTSLTLHLNANEDPDLEFVNEDEDRIRSRSTSVSKSRSRAGSNSSGEREKRYVVTKWEERGPVDSIIGFGGKTIQKLHNSWIRPMTTLLILLVAGTKHFIHTHPLSDGILNFIFAAIVTFITEARDIVLAELSSKHPRMVYYTEDYSKPIKRAAHSAQSSISSAVNVDPRISARPQSPASSVRSRTSTRAPFPAPSAGSPTTSASTVFATGAVSKKPQEQDHPSFAEVVKEGDTGAASIDKKKKGDEPRKLGRPIQATTVDEGHPSYAQVVLEGDEEHDHHQLHRIDHPTESHRGAERRQREMDTHAAIATQHHDEHASYAEVAADGVIEGHH